MFRCPSNFYPEPPETNPVQLGGGLGNSPSIARRVNATMVMSGIAIIGRMRDSGITKKAATKAVFLHSR